MTEDQLRYRFNKIFFEKIGEEDGQWMLKPEWYAIAGGALRDSLTGAKLKDIDIFCKDEHAVKQLEAWFNAQEGVKILEGNNVLSNYMLDGYWFQIIRDKFYDLETKELIENFDFTICGIMMHNDEIRVLDNFYQDNLCKHLRINKIIYPLSTFERMQKYIKKGYTACNGTMLEIAKALQTVDMDNPDEDSLSFYPDGTPRFVGMD